MVLKQALCAGFAHQVTANPTLRDVGFDRVLHDVTAQRANEAANIVLEQIR